ncbi:DUF3072 domain-containing protein [Rathayibacter toxicus]|nr:hypothetical protein C5D35_02940 [Rathayibacter toxicus]QOD10012.1 DUF3072 domain-containing protein [Rathayibacter toxicus]QWL28688.1 DUF3072 domain-containing protein [Rathayibacter toxicus]QWL30775.1 DUF3072 domain-containing protein [Rathayibacter toxicus]QWL32872.1 DUF3072 domain-containing protein [Rathayibacter toxicus]
MTGPQRSYLDTLAREAGEALPANLTKAQASEQIDRLQSATRRCSRRDEWAGPPLCCGRQLLRRRSVCDKFLPVRGFLNTVGSATVNSQPVV